MMTLRDLLEAEGARRPTTLAEDGIRRAAVQVVPSESARSEPVPYGQWLDEHGHVVDQRGPDYRWDYQHFRVMQEALDAVTRGDEKRVVFEVAVRHGKTAHNSQGYGGYRIHQDPRTRLLVASYNEKQAHRLSRQIRRIARDEMGVAMAKGNDAAGEWATAEGGGLIAVGAGAGVASVNADLIIIDDPIGNRAEAESAAHRDKVWEWITDDILARAEPHTGVIFSMPRWHKDDPIGRIKDRQSGLWRFVTMPGVAPHPKKGETLVPDVLGRAPGDLLWPEERPQSWVDDTMTILGSYGFASLVQCEPRPREGGMFRWDWWQLIDVVPAVGPMVRYWDTAGTEVREGNDPDFTAGALACRMVDGRTAVVDIQAFQSSVGQRDARMEEIARADLAKYGGRVVWWIETESGIRGTERTREIVKRIQNVGLACYADARPSDPKHVRAEPLASKAEAGNVCLCPDTKENPWRDRFRLQAADFPGGDHDDEVDAVTGADAKLSVPRAQVSFGSWSM